MVVIKKVYVKDDISEQKRALNNIYDVCLIGCWSIENHGSNMTYYALYKKLANMGYDVLMVERPWSAAWKPAELPEGFSKNPYPDYALSRIFDDKCDMKHLNDMSDVFVLGSDQLLYHDLYKNFDEFIDMDYIHSNKTKIAYSTSLGRTIFEGTENQRARMSLFLQKYDAISVRESNTIDAINEQFGISAVWMPDPVFLLEQKDWNLLLDDFSINSKELPYIGAYILDISDDKEKALVDFADKHQSPLKVFSDIIYDNKDVFGRDIEYDVSSSNEEWLSAIRNSDIFVTDSFHGTCFAIIYNKPFISIANKRRGYERFSSLLEHFELSEYLVDDVKKIGSINIDITRLKEQFKNVNQIIADDRLMAERWLREKIEKKHYKALSEFDVLSDNMDSLAVKENETRERSLNTENWLANTHLRVDQVEVHQKKMEEDIEYINQYIDNLKRYIEELQVSNNDLRTRLEKNKSLWGCHQGYNVEKKELISNNDKSECGKVYYEVVGFYKLIILV